MHSNNDSSASTPLQKITYPILQFIQQEKSGGIVLGISVVVAMLLANSTWSAAYFHVLEYPVGLLVNGEPVFNFSLHHWINDGLMSIFFFVVGLELKRELVNGELSQPKKALLPIVAAFGGMLVPALIYLFLNPTGEVHSGWGIPMATDIAFALGVLFLLGDRIPVALKVFLTALAIVDDLGAVLVIAFFYTSTISMVNLLAALGFLAVMFIANRMGVRNVLFYALIGIFGVWIAFLLSGIHATIAAVLAAFMIPSKVTISEKKIVQKIQKALHRFSAEDVNEKKPSLTSDQIYHLEQLRTFTTQTLPPLQRLEHRLHPYVTFLVIPIFALANAGVSLEIDGSSLFSTNVFLGVALGLLVGKVVGVVGFTWLLVRLKVSPYPNGMNFQKLLGLGFLAAIGFTMSLFITTLAFEHEVYQVQAKMGIFVASIIGGVIGYWLLSRTQS
ncbi:MAG TPA: Na+/H+ antiporter NhaA [Flavipsychrobacter sp.]|jgi:NhaA family Na+:H+ antiporter|nr:Na+/H+ antiporter NhaA [Flavipsychrobacter sp.]